MASGWISKAARYFIYQRDNNTCCYCGKVCVHSNGNAQTMRLNNQDFATLDHIVSRHEIAVKCIDEAEYRKEVRNPKNLVTVCNGCNASKRHSPLNIWCEIKGFDYVAIMAEIARRVA